MPNIARPFRSLFFSLLFPAAALLAQPRQTASASNLPSSSGQLGGVIEQEGPIHISNVMLLDAKGKPTRVGVEREGGHRFRVAKSTGTRLE